MPNIAVYAVPKVVVEIEDIEDKRLAQAVCAGWRVCAASAPAIAPFRSSGWRKERCYLHAPATELQHTGAVAAQAQIPGDHK